MAEENVGRRIPHVPEHGQSLTRIPTTVRLGSANRNAPWTLGDSTRVPPTEPSRRHVEIPYPPRNFAVNHHGAEARDMATNMVRHGRRSRYPLPFVLIRPRSCHVQGLKIHWPSFPTPATIPTPITTTPPTSTSTGERSDA